LKRRFVILVFLLIIVDQSIKVYISKFYMEPHVHVTVIDGVLNFCPMQNKNLGWIPNMLGYMMPVHMAVLLDVIAVLLTAAAYRYLKFCSFDWEKYKNLSAIFLAMFLSGIFCGLIDNIFWGGSIDYIRLFDWFTFDLKDFYIAVGEALVLFYLIIFLIRYYKLTKEERKEHDKNLGFFRWLKLGLPLKP